MKLSASDAEEEKSSKDQTSNEHLEEEDKNIECLEENENEFVNELVNPHSCPFINLFKRTQRTSLY